MLYMFSIQSFIFFFFNDTATTVIYTYRHTLSQHVALPILDEQGFLANHSGCAPSDSIRPSEREAIARHQLLVGEVYRSIAGRASASVFCCRWRVSGTADAVVGATA